MGGWQRKKYEKKIKMKKKKYKKNSKKYFKCLE